jgi:uncharacterized protein with NAD-binding domain and iron-sulfur cluster
VFHHQVRQLFPSARNLNMTWHSIVKIGQSLYREAPGMDPYRPDQTTPVPNFFLAGSYTKQVRRQHIFGGMGWYQGVRVRSIGMHWGCRLLAGIPAVARLC